MILGSFCNLTRKFKKLFPVEWRRLVSIKSK